MIAVFLPNWNAITKKEQKIMLVIVLESKELFPLSYKNLTCGIQSHESQWKIIGAVVGWQGS